MVPLHPELLKLPVLVLQPSAFRRQLAHSKVEPLPLPVDVVHQGTEVGLPAGPGVKVGGDGTGFGFRIGWSQPLRLGDHLAVEADEAVEGGLQAGRRTDPAGDLGGVARVVAPDLLEQEVGTVRPCQGPEAEVEPAESSSPALVTRVPSPR